MTCKPIFHCTICHQPAENPYLCLDRRVEKVSVVARDGKPVTTIKIAVCQTMFIYCSHRCWQIHQPSVASDLLLQSAYPHFSFVTPCSRCGASVDRKQNYVNYSISEMNLMGVEPYLSAQCIDDHDFAVLCRNCEEADLPKADAQSHNTNEEKGVFA